MGIFKIAPGKNAKFWENNDCLDNRHICVGWRRVGDLKAYRSEQELRTAVNDRHYNGRAAGPAANIAGQLWTLRNLKNGDRVVANKGNSVVLRVGTVTNGGYKWESKHDYPHTVSVDWGDPCERRKIGAQKEWNNKTVAPVSPELFALIARRLGLKEVAIGAQQSLPSQEELTILGELEDERRVSTRKEQQRLRKYLLDGKDYGWCFLCGEKFPAELLVTAHIKKRAHCSDNEKRDPANVVAMCLLGCDALFERGRVAVVKNKIETRLNGAHSPSRLHSLVKVLRSRELEIESRRKPYFEWHSKQARTSS